MPLRKRKPFSLLERPEDVKPKELVFQVPFTKEIFREYGEYLKRMNLYRQRVWSCKITGKTNLTYEEALVLEKQATEKVQNFPKELMEPVLRDVQFSMLTLRELVSSIAAKLQVRLLEGTETYGRKNNCIYPCKIVKILLEEVNKTQYQVAWLDKDKKVTESAVVDEEDLIKKKMPFGRDVLRSFIRESTCRSVPWVLHDRLALKYGISTDPPQELKSKFLSKSGVRKRKISEKDGEANGGEPKRKNLEKCAEKEDVMPIKYPIDDLLVQPTADDPIFTSRPPLAREFNVPMECVGDLLMVWDFSSSFSKLLNLSPFSLVDFENALCHKDSNVVLIMEYYSALLRTLIKDGGDYYIAIQKKNRKSKIALDKWTDYLCDFLEVVSNAELSTLISRIRRGLYRHLDTDAKLGIFVELVGEALATDVMREKLDEYVQDRQALVATRREGRKKREMAKMEPIPNGVEVELTTGSIKLAPGKVSNKFMNVDKNKTEDKRDTEQSKAYVAREMEKRSTRTNPLGRDRDYKRYWFFQKDARIFVESRDDNQWGYYSTKDELDSLIGSLNEKGERERALKKQLEKHYNRISREMQKGSKVEMDEEVVVRRSSRVCVPTKENPALAFLNYVNKL